MALAEVISLDETRATSKLDAQLARSDKGVILSDVSNLQLIIAQDPNLAGIVGYNEFTCAPVLHRAPPVPLEDAAPIPGPYPRPWDDADVTHIQTYIMRVWAKQATQPTTEQALNSVASLCRFHPVKDWLGGLVWDGVARIDTWLQTAFGAPTDVYHSDVGAKMLIAAVRRVRQPGVKFDHMPVFEGPQGIGKSTALRELFGTKWFTDSLPAKMESADAALGLQGVWGVEFAEIEQIIRAEVEIIKAFLSRPVDRFRAPYGRRFLTYPRQCILVGTTNDSAYLRDSTGNRRFWPLHCPLAAPGWVTENREQLWAEAAVREATGEDHWLTEAETIQEAATQQSYRIQDDPWDDAIERYASGEQVIKVNELLSTVFDIAPSKQTKSDEMRVARILRGLRWQREVVRVTTFSGSKVVRQWVRR